MRWASERVLSLLQLTCLLSRRPFSCDPVTPRFCQTQLPGKDWNPAYLHRDSRLLGRVWNPHVM